MSDLLDPTSATSAAFSRKLFVGLSAGAAAVAATAGSAGAQQAEFGKPHDPIVSESDPDIVVERVTLARPGVALPAYTARPRHAGPATPSIVMVQHIWGVDSTIRDDVRRYAKAGFTCIAPDLFVRSHAPSGDGVTDINLFRPAAKALVPDETHGDLLAARMWAAKHAPEGKIGITGFCMGGSIALQQLFGTGDYAAASVFYGSVRQAGTPDDTPNPFAAAASIRTPLRGNYGERDTSIAPADVRSFFGALTVPHELDIYPEAGHAFFDDTRAAYVASAATDAWTKTLAWFHRYLT